MSEKLKTRNLIFIAVTVILVITIIVLICINPWKMEKYDPNNYNGTVHNVSGGQMQDDANINRITFENVDGAVNIKLSFVSGSGTETEVKPCGIPQYNVSFLPSPLRLKISFSSVVYWDYMITGTPEDTTGLINGMFQMSPQNEGGNVDLYFSLTKTVRFKISENENGLTVSLKPEDIEDDSEKWYLISDLYYEYQVGNMPDCGFTPMLCDDKISVIMISEAYNTQEEANREMDKLLTSSLEGRNIRIISLKESQLPQYMDNSDAQALLSESVLSINGAKTTLPLFYADARFLCWLPDGSGALFAKNENGLEKLYIADKTGTKHLISEKEFATVVEANFSSDGSRVAFIEQAEETSLVTVLDVETGKITVINDENNPWGEIIMGVQLNGNGTKLYCLSGNTTYSIKTYDFASGEVTTLKDNILLEGNLKYNNGYLYYCDVINEYEAVVRQSVNGSDVELVHKGSQFVVSPDGKNIAVIIEDYETAVCDLRLVDIETKASEIVLGDIVTSEFFFNSDGKSIFYVLETGDPEYYYQIVRYDIDKKETYTLAQCINSVVYPSDKPNEIIISVIYQGENGATPVTYIADFDKMVVGETEEPQE